MAFFHRVVPAVITVELTEAFALSATALGHLSALYFYAHVPLQIPFGAAAVAFGARRVLTVGGAPATRFAVSALKRHHAARRLLAEAQMAREHRTPLRQRASS